MAEWRELGERTSRSSQVVPWRTGDTPTYAYISRINGKWFVAQFDRKSGKLVKRLSSQTAASERDAQIAWEVTMLEMQLDPPHLTVAIFRDQPEIETFARMHEVALGSGCLPRNTLKVAPADQMRQGVITRVAVETSDGWIYFH